MISRYDYEFDPGDQSTAALVCRWAGEHGGRVLELGCAAGAMSRILSEHYKLKVTGIEYDVTAAGFAEPFCERVIVADLNASSWSSLLGADRFDVIIAADVLEHLSNPATCLEQIRNLLAPRGKIVISVPNIAHNGVIAALFNNDFPYSDIGLLDRTHTHFFTSLSLRRMLEQTGFHVEGMKHIEAAPCHEEFRVYWERLPERIRAWLARSPAGATYQIVVKAVPDAKRNTCTTSSKSEVLGWLDDCPPEAGVDAAATDAQALPLVKSLTQQRDEALLRAESIEHSRIWRWSIPYRWLRDKLRSRL